MVKMPTWVSGLVSYGQRRSDPMAPFPVHPTDGTTGPGGGYLDSSLDGEGETPEDSPCNDPEKRREWDIDAAAAKARKGFLEKAAADVNTSLAYRERGAVLYRGPDGSIEVGPIAEGPPLQGKVEYSFAGINKRDVVGIIHVHPATSGGPSGPDWDLFERLSGQIAAAGGDPTNFRAYVVGTPHPPSAIRVYSNTERTNGPEVNPDGQPC